MNWNRLDKFELELLRDLLSGKEHFMTNKISGVLGSKLKFLIRDMDKSKAWEVDLVIVEKEATR